MDGNELTKQIRSSLSDLDERAWPRPALDVLTRHNVWANSVGTDFGGVGATPIERLTTYERVAAGSLSVALILTQHDAACELLGDCDNEGLARELLPRCARGGTLLTVGISQLTTSRQGGKPAMKAQSVQGGFRFDGVMPWVTSGSIADHVVAGGVLDDERQVLVCLPLNAQGIRVGAPFDLMSLTSSCTCPVYCEDATVSADYVLRGPIVNALARRAPVKGLTVSAVGLGHARAMIDACRGNVEGPARIEPSTIETIEAHWADIRSRLHDAASSSGMAEAERPTTAIRATVNDLLARVAATLMTLAKGSGYVSGQPAERLVREAMFFYVWSATNEVRGQTIESLWAHVP